MFNVFYSVPIQIYTLRRKVGKHNYDMSKEKLKGLCVVSILINYDKNMLMKKHLYGKNNTYVNTASLLMDNINPFFALVIVLYSSSFIIRLVYQGNANKIIHTKFLKSYFMKT